MIALQEEYGPRRKRAGQLQDEAREPGRLSVRMTQGIPRDVVTDTSRMERVQQSGAIARLGWPQDTSTDWEGDIPKDQDKVRDCRERCSSWTGLDDLRGRQPPSPFLYVHFVPERVNDIGLYSLPQHILCALEPPSIWVPIGHSHSPPTLRERCFGLVLLPASNHLQSWLIACDHINIPARQKHRAKWTHPDMTTVWLCVFY